MDEDKLALGLKMVEEQNVRRRSCGRKMELWKPLTRKQPSKALRHRAQDLTVKVA